MYIDEDVLREYLENEKLKVLCDQKQDIVELWEQTIEGISSLLKQEKVSGVKYYEYQGQDTNGLAVLNKMLEEFGGDKELFKAYAFVFGGVKFNDKNALPADPKIMKIAHGRDDFLNDIFSSISKKNTYNLLTNNHPKNLVSFLKSDNKKIEEKIKESRLVISHPWDIMEDSYKGKEDLRKQLSEQPTQAFELTNFEKIAYRFPLKFLWMWANRENMIHPLSLMAFREFLKSDFMTEIFNELSKKNNKSSLSGMKYDTDKEMGNDASKYARQITNARIEFFPKLWSEVSDAIMKKFYEEKQENGKNGENLEKVSKLISLLTLGETDMTNIDELLKTHKQIILYGVPGTGKTHSAKELIKKWSKEKFADGESDKKIQDEIDQWQLSKLLSPQKIENAENTGDKKDQENESQKVKIVWEIMQFHPNTTYQDFIGGIVPKTDDKGTLSYELRNGKFKQFCECASQNPQTRFVFIIDEINRANLSEVLGELLYALEYRGEGITIPNFSEPFIIPNNVYIIGTMNNVDKSLSTFDLALRRRFGFYEIKPDLEILNEMLSFKEDEKGELKSFIDNIEDYIARCKNLNQKIEEKLGDKNSQIGQAYFGKIKHFLEEKKENQAVTPFHLQKLWDYHLEPLLREYVGFVEEGEKIIEDLKKTWLDKVEEQ